MKIKFVNIDIEKDLYEYVYQYFYDQITYYLEVLSLKDINLEVHFVNRSLKQFNEECGAAGMQKKHNKYFVFITKSVISNLMNGKEKNVESAVLHEIYHVYDYIQIYKSKDIKFRPNQSNWTFSNAVMRVGFCNWTEYHSYARCYFVVNDREFTTLKSLVNRYKKIKTIHKDILKEVHKYKENTSEILNNKIDLLFDKLEFLSYLSMDYLAWNNFGGKYNYKYCDKTLNDPDFIWIQKYVKGLNKYMSKMTHGTYGKYFETRLYKIGDYILRKLYIPFNIGIGKENNQYFMAFGIENKL